MKRAILSNKRLVTPTVCAVALILALVFTRGMTPSFDSVRYANVAHWLAAGEGVATSLTVVPVQEGTPAVGNGLHAFTIQPPGLPLFYALTGVDNRGLSHRGLHLVAFVCLTWLVLALGRQLTGRTEVGVAAALLTMSSPAVLLTTANFWTDLPTATFLFGALYLVIRSREPGPRAWAWLAGASILSAAAVSLRLTSLAFGAVLLTDLLLSRRLPWRKQLIRLAAGSGVFGVTTLWLLWRNATLSGSFTGVAAHTSPLAPAFSLARGWAYLGSRLIQGLVPGWTFDQVTQSLATANSQAGGWAIPAALVFVTAGMTGAVVILRRKKRLAWPRSTGHPVPGAAALALALFAASVVVLLLPAARNPDFHAVEIRYVITFLPLLWIGLMGVLMSTGRRVGDLSLATALVLLFAIGVPGRHQPYQHGHEYMRTGLDWLELTVPPETAVLSNGGKVLLDENLARRVFHLSDWNYHHALGPDMKTDAGLLRYLQKHEIRYVVLFGKPDMHKATYWGRPLIGLFLEQRWGSWLAYRDQYLKVYRIPPTGPPPAES